VNLNKFQFWKIFFKKGSKMWFWIKRFWGICSRKYTCWTLCGWICGGTCIKGRGRNETN